MSSFLKKYYFKITLPENKKKYLSNFKQLIEKATKQSLEKLWSEEWITQLGITTVKAHCIITAGRISIEEEGKKIYLPSRVRMGIAERIGRILRSQYKRMKCFNDCLKIMEIVGVNENESKLIKLLNLTFRSYKNKPYYKKVLLLQNIRLIKNWQQKISIDFHMLSYCNIVKPTIKNFVFPYGPDNYRELDYMVRNTSIWFKIRLPTTINSRSINDWEWIEGLIPIPEKLQKKINESTNQHPKKPRMITKTLKGGKEYFFFSFPWNFEKKKVVQKERTRALAVDLGLKKIATAVVCEKDKQLSKPIYLKITSKQYQHIERLFKHLQGISIQIKRKTGNHRKQQEEQARIYRKLSRIKHQLVQTTTTILIDKAKQWNCSEIILEDLRMFRPKKGLRKWSRRLNEWLHGQIAQILEYKTNEEGIKLLKVTPWGTSIHCPRCTNTRGLKVTSPTILTPKKSGRWFYCPNCGFNADRDYNAALNIFRARFINYRKIKSLKDTSPIPYMEIGIPSPDRSWRRSRNDLTTTQVVLVTGG